MSSTLETIPPPIGTDRFLIQQKLGSGAFGDVFQAWDQKLEATVALKTLHRADPAAIYHFKNEFRSLADVTHPNLVQLYELQSEDQRWFFTMELVEGLDFIEYAGATAGELSDTTQVHPLPVPVVRHDFHRLRAALRQLAEGLCALHRAGKLHCDIKPTNLRITADGRLVLLDFGLVYDLRSPMFQTMVGEVRGTPAYMSPEQAVGRDVTEASDWYAVGGVLYEALTGELPFSGSVLEVLKVKQVSDGPTPRKAVPYLPDDLVELCEGLLAKEPSKRPTGEQILERLGGGWMGLPELGTVRRARHFVGRELELAALEEAFELSRQGETVAVFVRGASGMGKTELVGRLVDRVRQGEAAPVVLAGRCYERESVPFKGLDALIDTLSRYLKQLSYDRAAALMPSEVQALARLFPALRRVEAVAAAPVLELSDEREQKRQARSALRELFTRLAKRSPVLLVIDDLQWGDLDSAEMLADLLALPPAPPLLLVGCYLDQGTGDEPLLQQLLTRPPAEAAPPLGPAPPHEEPIACSKRLLAPRDAPPAAKRLGPAPPHEEPIACSKRLLVRELEVGELWFSEACELGLKLLGHRRTPALGLVRAIAHESRGSPFFIAELVRYVRSELGSIGGGAVSNAEDLAPSGLSLENLIRSRLGRLPGGARRLLEVVAVAGRPVALDTAVAAAGLQDSSQMAVKVLLAGNLLRMCGTPGRELEVAHERIRETVLAGLGGRQAPLHGRLARALEVKAPADPETLTLHFHAAGESARAAELAAVAARQALRALAFDRAVRLYRLALELLASRPSGPESDGDVFSRRRLQVELGDALVNAGRRPEAGKAYLAAAAASSGRQALELQRRACEQQFFGGDFDGCRESLQTVLASIGLKLPSSWLRAVASSALSRLRLWLGKCPRVHKPDGRRDDSRQNEAWSLDVLSTAIIVSTRSPLRSMDFQCRYRLLAARAGEPDHLLHSAAIEAAVSAAGGTRRRRRTAERLATVARRAEHIGSPNALAEATYVAGFAALLESRVIEAGDLLERSERLWRRSGSDSFWGGSRVSVLRIYALMLRGRLRDVRNRMPGMLKDLAAKGNLYDETDLRSRAAWLARLAADQPERAAKEVHRAHALLERQVTSELWSSSGVHRLRYFHLVGQVEIALYQGRGAEAWRILEASWGELCRGLHFRVQLLRAEALGLRCRAAIAAATHAESPQTQRHLKRVALAAGRRLEAEKLGWAQALAGLVRAAAAAHEGRSDDAADRLTVAEAGFEATGFELHAAVCRRRRGELLGTGAGSELIAAADAWMLRHGVASPQRMARVVAPGFHGCGVY